MYNPKSLWYVNQQKMHEQLVQQYTEWLVYTSPVYSIIMSILLSDFSFSSLLSGELQDPLWTVTPLSKNAGFYKCGSRIICSQATSSAIILGVSLLKAGDAASHLLHFWVGKCQSVVLRHTAILSQEVSCPKVIHSLDMGAYSISVSANLTLSTIILFCVRRAGKQCEDLLWRLLPWK